MHPLYSKPDSKTSELKLCSSTNQILSTGKDSQALLASNLMNHSPLTRRRKRTASSTLATCYRATIDGQAKSKKQREAYLAASTLRWEQHVAPEKHRAGESCRS